jgi:hypothetical protein
MNDTDLSTADVLVNEIDNIIFDMVDASFRPYFVHVGFS